MVGIGIIVVLLAIIFVITVKAIKIVPESKVYVVERLGKYSQGLRSGLHFINPFFDKISKVISFPTTAGYYKG